MAAAAPRPPQLRRPTRPPAEWAAEGSLSPQVLRYWRSYLIGVMALGAEPDRDTWSAFSVSLDALGPFEELLKEGHVNAALAVYRA